MDRKRSIKWFHPKAERDHITFYDVDRPSAEMQTAGYSRLRSDITQPLNVEIVNFAEIDFHTLIPQSQIPPHMEVS